jgi:hypothetical protein
MPKIRNQIRKSELACALAEGGTLTDWAKKTEVAERTACTWSRSREVIDEVAAIRSAALDRAVGRLSGEVSEAAEQILTLAKAAESEAVRLQAARAVRAERTAVTRRAELERRMAEIERRLAAASPTPDTGIAPGPVGPATDAGRMRGPTAPAAPFGAVGIIGTAGSGRSPKLTVRRREAPKTGRRRSADRSGAAPKSQGFHQPPLATLRRSLSIAAFQHPADERISGPLSLGIPASAAVRGAAERLDRDRGVPGPAPESDRPTCPAPASRGRARRSARPSGLIGEPPGSPYRPAVPVSGPVPGPADPERSGTSHTSGRTAPPARAPAPRRGPTARAPAGRGRGR